MTGRPNPVALVALVFGIVVGVSGSAAWAAFSSQTGTVATFGTKRIYSAARTTTAFDVDDAADGSAADVSPALAFADGASLTTKQWTAAAFNTAATSTSTSTRRSPPGSP